MRASGEGGEAPSWRKNFSYYPSRHHILTAAFAAYHLRSDRRDGSEQTALELTRGTMLDHCLVLRKNGVLLWRQSWAPMKGNPVDTLIRTVLMEVRRCTACAGIAWLVHVQCQAGLHECSSRTSARILSLSLARARARARSVFFGSGVLSPACQERGGVDIYQDDASTVKWSMDNELDIIIVAIYQRGLVLQYVDELLTVCKQQFATMLRQLPPEQWDGVWPCNKFTATFSKLQQDVEKRAIETKLQQKKPRSFSDSKKFQNTRQGARLPPRRRAAVPLCRHAAASLCRSCASACL